MKIVRYSFILLFGLLLVGCSVEGETATAVPTRVAMITNTAVPTPTTLPATGTAVPSPTSTATSLPVTAISTALSTAVPTETPTITPTPLPPPPGEIYFFWDSQQLPHSGQGDPIQSLYRARPGSTSADWQIAPVLNDIIGVPYISLAPDQISFVLTMLEDRNGDGHVSFEGHNRGFDGPNVFVYSRKDGSLTRITSDFPIIFNPEWGAAGQTILYGQSTYGLSSISVADGVSHLIASFPEDQITWTDVSPDGRLVALNLDSIQISIVDTQTGEVTQITNEIGGFGVERVWSPDNKWLALNQPLANYFSLVNTETTEVIPVAELNPIYPPTWSPSSHTLALVQNNSQGSALFLLDPLLLSSGQLFSSSGQIYNLLWSPDGLELAIAIIEGSKTSLGIIQIESGEFHEIWQSMDSTRVFMPAWSPDGEWLLFFDGKGTSLDHSEPAGIYVIHRSGVTVQRILETSGSSDPFGFFWLPITETP